MNILVLTKYSRQAASSRQRFYQFFPALESLGFSLRAQALLGDEYLAAMIEGRRRPVGVVLDAYRERWRLLRGASRADLVVIHFEAFPYLPDFAERQLARAGVPYVLDLDDAIFHQYDQHRNPLVRALLGGKIARIMRGAAAVHAGSRYIADYARAAGARRVELLPTVVDTARLSPAPSRTGPGFRVGWIGSPSTSSYLADVAPALAQFHRVRPDAEFVLVGARADALPGLPVTRKPWSEATEADDLRAFDVGIMPLRDDPWSRGKCGFKLVQYMACGLPVVASPVGANADIVRAGVNGLLASTPDEWVAALAALAESPAERERMGREGRATVIARYSVDAVLPALAASLRAAATA
ncbi:MAG: glycosyltransferase family 4 protein [Burkholderiales bacterium]